MTLRLSLPKEEYVVGGHLACQGCGAVLAMRHLLKGLGPRTVVSIPASCWAVIVGSQDHGQLEVPFVNTAFEGTGASISGIQAALEAQGVEDVTVVGFAGDGGTVDIGLQALSGFLERGDHGLYVMYDNEAYMNTGIQKSGATPTGAWTTTTPADGGARGKAGPKKDVMSIVLAHRLPYAATAAIGFPEDLVRKARKAKETRGPKFLHVLSPCPPGWRYPSEKTVEVARLAVDTKLFPLYEVEEGRLRVTRKPHRPRPVADYLALQGRFAHFDEALTERVQREADANWARLLRLEEQTAEEPLW